MLWEFCGDRWRETCFLLQHEAWTPVIEPPSAGVEDDPVCGPVYQELLLDRKRADQHEVQLFGRAGKVLFAAAVTFDAAAEAIEYDVSARSRSEAFPASFLTTYSVPGFERQGAAVVIGSGAESKLRLDPVLVEDFPVCEVLDGPRQSLQIRASGPTRMSPEQAGVTFRWRYRIQRHDDA